jgi:large subunit ribosomal protein L9
MKVILKKEVDNLGLAGDVVTVADGYGRNYLIPRGLAILATKGAMKEAQALTRSRKAREAQTVDQAADYKTVLEERTLRIPARVDDRGHLYGSVGVTEIHRILKERGHDIEKKRIELRGSIKELGTYEIDVRVHPQVTATVTVEIVDEEGKVVAGQKAPPPPPLPGEAVDEVQAPDVDAPTSVIDTLAEQALEAAEELEQADEDQADADASEAAVASEAATDDAATDEASSEEPEQA